MHVFVDTNVLIDILTDDQHWADWSLEHLEKYSDSGLVINPIVYSELCFGSPSTYFVDDIIRSFTLIYQEIPKKGLFKASKAFKLYKSRHGAKTFVLPDFFIGGHAETAKMAILTRDTKRYRTYFPDVRLICPK